MIWLKQSTAITLRFGPFLDDTDGKTPETALTIAQADVRISKNGAAFAQKSDATSATHDESGWYSIPFNATDTGTLGSTTIAVDETGALPVWREFMVVPANVYNSLVADSDVLNTDVIQLGGAAQSLTDLKDFADDGYDPVTHQVEAVKVVESLSVGSSAISTPSYSNYITYGFQTGTFADTTARDGVHNVLNDSSGTLDMYYNFSVGATGIPVSTTFYGRANSSNDDIKVYAWKWSGGIWEQIGVIEGTNLSSDSEHTFTLYSSHVATGALAGNISIRFYNTGLSGNNLRIDQLYISYSIVQSTVGYANGSIWLDTVNGTDGSVKDVDGVADNKCKTWANVLSLMTSTKLDIVTISLGSSVTLAASTSSMSLRGAGYSLALGGQALSSVFITGASLSGTSSAGAGSLNIKECVLGDCTLPPCTISQSAFTAKIIAASVGDFLLDHCSSRVAGSGTPDFDFGTGKGGACNLSVRHYSGGIRIWNFGKDALEKMSLEGHGQLKIDASCDPSNTPIMSLRGHFKVTDFVVGGFVAGGGVINQIARYGTDAVRTASEIAIWASEPISANLKQIDDVNLSESTNGRLANNFSTFYDNSDAATAKVVDDVGGGSGSSLTQQNVRDAMKLAPTAGAAAANSVDEKLDTTETKVDVVDTNVDAILVDTGTSGVIVATNNDKTGYSISGTKQTLDSLNDLTAAEVQSEVEDGITASEPITANVIQLGGVAQSLADLKDFADDGYDPTTNKVEGVKLTDTTTTNTDMRGTNSAATSSELSTHDSKLDTVDANVDSVLVDTGEIGAAGVGLSNLGGMSTAMKAEIQLEVEEGLAATEPIEANVVQLDGVAQSLTDLKDFADSGYDPATNKVEGVKLTDTTTTNTDMRGTNSAATAASLSAHDAKLDTVDTNIDTVNSNIGSPVDIGDGATLSSGITALAGKTTDAGSYSRATDSQEALADASSSGLTQQNVRDAMKLAPSGGAPIAGSVDEKLDTTETKVDTVDTTVDAILVDTGTSGVIVATNNDKAGYSISGTKQTLDALNDLTAAEVQSEVEDGITASEPISANVIQLGGVSQSLIDLKDFADFGYDPATNKVEGVKLTDTTTTNTDMRGTDSAATAAMLAAHDAKLDTVDANVDAVLVDTAEIGTAGIGLSNLGGMSTAMKAEVQSEVEDGITASEPIDANVTQLGGVAQSLIDLKDFADSGYDPATNKVEGVKLVDTTTTNTDMRGTNSAATSAALAAHDGKLDTVDANVDAVLVDTGTSGVVVNSNTTNGKAEIQAEVNDALLAYDSNGGVAKESSVSDIQNNTRFVTSIPANFLIPDTTPNVYKLVSIFYDADGALEDPDSNELSINLETASGADKNTILYKEYAVTSPLDNSSISGFKKLEREELGVYYCYIKISSTETEAQLMYDFKLTEATVGFTYTRSNSVFSESPGTSTLADNTTNKQIIAKSLKERDVSGVSAVSGSVYQDINNNIDANETKIDTSISKIDVVDANVDSILVDTAEIGVAGAGLTDLGGMSTAMKAEVQLEVEDGLTASEPIDANVVQLGGNAQSLIDLKDFADDGYDPATNKVEGVKLTDTTTVNTDMRGTDSAATAASLSTHDSKLDVVDANVDDILVDTAEIGVSGYGLSNLGGMSTAMKAEVQTEVEDGITTSEPIDANVTQWNSNAVNTGATSGHPVVDSQAISDSTTAANNVEANIANLNATVSSRAIPGDDMGITTAAKNDIVDRNWNEATADHQVAGSTGKALTDAEDNVGPVTLADNTTNKDVVADGVLSTPANKLDTDANGRVDVSLIEGVDATDQIETYSEIGAIAGITASEPIDANTTKWNGSDVSNGTVSGLPAVDAQAISNNAAAADNVEANITNLNATVSSRAIPGDDMGITTADKNDVVDKVWDETQADHVTAGTTGKSLDDARDAVGNVTLADNTTNKDIIAESVLTTPANTINTDASGRVDVSLIEGVDATTQLEDAAESGAGTAITSAEPINSNVTNWAGSSVSNGITSGHPVVDAQAISDSTTAANNVESNITNLDTLVSSRAEPGDDMGIANIDKDDIVNKVWDESQASHVAAGTTGKSLLDASSGISGDVTLDDSAANKLIIAEGILSTPANKLDTDADGRVDISLIEGIDATSQLTDAAEIGAENAINSAEPIDSNVVNWAGSAVSNGTTSGMPVVDSQAISDSTTAANNVEANIDSLDVAVSTRAVPGDEMDIAATTEDNIVDKVWDEAQADHLTAGSTGKSLADGASSAGEVTLADNAANKQIVAEGVLETPANKLATDIDGGVNTTLIEGTDATDQIESSSEVGAAAAINSAEPIDSNVVNWNGSSVSNGATSGYPVVDAQAISDSTVTANSVEANIDNLDATVSSRAIPGDTMDITTAAKDDIVDKTWDEAQADHLTAGSTGESLNEASQNTGNVTLADNVANKDIISESVLTTPANKLDTDANGRVDVSLIEGTDATDVLETTSETGATNAISISEPIDTNVTHWDSSAVSTGTTSGHPVVDAQAISDSIGAADDVEANIDNLDTTVSSRAIAGDAMDITTAAKDDVVDRTWDEAQTDHVTAGTTGKSLADGASGGGGDVTLADSAANKLIIAEGVLETPANKLVTDTDGRVDTSLIEGVDATDQIENSSQIGAAAAITAAEPVDANVTNWAGDSVSVGTTSGHPVVDAQAISDSTTAADNVEVNIGNLNATVSSRAIPGDEMSISTTTEDSIVDKVWDEAQADHVTVGTTGKSLADGASSTGEVTLADNATNKLIVAESVLETPANKLETDVLGHTTLADSVVNKGVVAEAVLKTPANKLETDAGGNVTLADNILNKDIVAEGVLVTPSNKLATDAIGNVTLSDSTDNNNVISESVLTTPANKLDTDTNGRVDVSLIEGVDATDQLETSTHIGASAAITTSEPIDANVTEWNGADVHVDATSALPAVDIGAISGNDVAAVNLKDNISNLNTTISSRAVAGDDMGIIEDDKNDIVDKVWDEATSSHVVVGSTGEAITDAQLSGDSVTLDNSTINKTIIGSGVLVNTVNKLATDAAGGVDISSSDKLDIASNVWDENLTGHNIVNSSSVILKATGDDTTLEDNASNRSLIASSVLANSANKLETDADGRVDVSKIEGVDASSQLVLSSKDGANLAIDESEPIDANVETWDGVAVSNSPTSSLPNVNSEAISDDTVAATSVVTNIDFLDTSVSSRAVAGDDMELSDTVKDDIVDKVWDEQLNGHLLAGSTGEALDGAGGEGKTDWTSSEKTQIRDSLGIDGVKTASTGGVINNIENKVDTVDGKIGTPKSIDGGAATLSGNINKIVDNNDGDDFDASTDSLKIIRESQLNLTSNELAQFKAALGMDDSGTAPADGDIQEIITIVTAMQTIINAIPNDGAMTSIAQEATLGTPSVTIAEDIATVLLGVTESNDELTDATTGLAALLTAIEKVPSDTMSSIVDGSVDLESAMKKILAYCSGNIVRVGTTYQYKDQAGASDVMTMVGDSTTRTRQ